MRDGNAFERYAAELRDAPYSSAAIAAAAEKLREAADEIERLRNALEISCGARELANQEIERLRSLCDSLADDVERLTSRLRVDDAYRTYLYAKVEIEELRRQRDAYVNEITGSLLPANGRLREEIERLQAQEIRFRAIEQAYLDAAMKDQDEIERLRAALNVENRSRG
jgi:hypothetical protein